ncbi:hypothetical protein [Luteolibacter marinus]|uniref:hypothetical protein n=1 Tax=Luteolibacter marinus TaxID=2776705 RepID=UPI00186787D9|nr:hypothetical protein [Luteolibacter marinus]
MQRLLNHKLTAIFLPALIGMGGAALSIKGFEEYGWSLFVGLPVAVSFLSAFCWSYRRPMSFGSAYGVASLSILALGGLIMIFALDGLICLLMALPLAMALGLVGAAAGRFVGSSIGAAGRSTILSLLCLAFPLLVGFEHATAPEPELREVTTSVLVDARIEDVWDTVIAFPEIHGTPEAIFRLGIAYPVKASIEGHGVGAIRYCTFSTGSFVEPVTEWDAPRRLSFDVTENPPAMKEFSLYDDLHAPHLHGYMTSKKGQFRLSEKDGRVLLEGTTWYTHRIAPAFYWGVVSDEIIHRIHLRVLGHIKRHAEGAGQIPAAID